MLVSFSCVIIKSIAFLYEVYLASYNASFERYVYLATLTRFDFMGLLLTASVKPWYISNVVFGVLCVSHLTKRLPIHIHESILGIMSTKVMRMQWFVLSFSKCPWNSLSSSFYHVNEVTHTHTHRGCWQSDQANPHTNANSHTQHCHVSSSI